MNKACKGHQKIGIKIYLVELLVCLLVIGVFGCGKKKDTKQVAEDNLGSWTGTYVYGTTFPHAPEEDINNFIGYTVAVYEDNGEY